MLVGLLDASHLMPLDVLPDLEVLTKPLDVSVGDEAGGEAEERFMDVVASFPADA